MTEVAQSGMPGPSENPAALRVLDAGCGRPTFLRALRRITGWHVTGVDWTDAGWRHDPPSTWEGIDLLVGGLEAQDLLTGPFHLITLWHVLEHLSDPRRTLKQLHEVSAPNAALLVEVPDHSSIPRRLQGAHWIGYDTPRHPLAYEPATLRRLLGETGWKVERFHRYGTMDPWVLWWLGRQAGKGRRIQGSLEDLFMPFRAGKVLTGPLVLLQRWRPLGAMTTLARRRA